MDNRPTRKILKSPVAKRRSRLVPKDQKITLEKVLGLTSTNNAALACDPNTGNIAYLAGCVVIIYNPKKNKQSHIFNISKKTLTAVAFSGDGKHLVTGESGHQPAVRIWDVAEKVQVAEFHGHKFGISCVAFSPNLKYMVSVGTQHDMQVNVWNWKSGSKVASNKISSKVTAVSFSVDGSYFVTAGMRHVKFWYLDSSKSKINETVPLSGRNGLLGDHKNNFFCDVAMGIGNQSNKTYCITQSGLLCQFNEKRQMDKWVELRTTCANSISASDDYVFVGCANGVVRVFDATSLYFVVTLPRPHYLGVDIAAALNPSHISTIKDGDIKYPDVVALAFDDGHRKVTCIYNDHSIYIWDVHDLKKIGKSWSFLYHSSCVYGVENYFGDTACSAFCESCGKTMNYKSSGENAEDSYHRKSLRIVQSDQVYPVLDLHQTSVLPNHSFITCSSDDTIRIWNLDPHMAQTDTYKSNIYSHDLLKIMYMDPSLASLCDVDYNPSGAADKTDTNYDDKNGIRSIRVSPDGQHLASGDRQGNVRIHELSHLTEVKQIEAHESEVLCLEYSHWQDGPKVLASSSRDRLVHVYDTEQNYGLLQTLSDHSSSISAVKFTETDGQMKMLTCGADKSILFRNLQQDPDFQFVLGDHLVEKMTLYDMDVEPSQKFAAIACQDRNVRIYNVKTGKKKKEYKGSLGDDGTLLKMKLDPSGSYAATSCSDKNLCVLDFYTGELVATMYGHSEIATDVRFMNDLKHLISTSGDGCIFIWRLPKEMTTHMQNRLQEMGKAPFLIANGSIKKDSLAKHLDELDSVPVSLGRDVFSPQKVLNEIYPDHNIANKAMIPDRNSPDFRFSISQLPSWAQKHYNGEGTSKPGADDSSKSDDDQAANRLPRGRWAQRVEGQTLTVKQQDGKSVEVDFATDRRRFTPERDGSPSQMSDMRRETMVLNRPTMAPKNMPIIQDDTVVEEDEDEEFLPVSSTTFVKPGLDKHQVNWDDLYNFDADEIEQPENTEIIYYPPSESDGSDTLASSYQVFDAGPLPDRNKGLKYSFSMNSNPDADSETTDPVSLEDTEEDDDTSAPGTPMEDFNPQHREKFLKDAFENLSFTPTLPTDKFVKGLDTLEEEMASNYSTSSINSRQSLSARFMSRSNNQRNTFGIQRQDNWFDSVQRRKDDMARNLDESRKMLMAMGWKQDSPETDKEDAFVESPPSLSKAKVTPEKLMGWKQDSPETDKEDTFVESPPSLSKAKVTPEKLGSIESPEGENTPTAFTFDHNHTLVENSGTPQSPRTPKSLRHCWSTMDLPKTPIPEEKGLKPSTPKSVGKRSVSTSNCSEIAKDKTPTGKMAALSSSRPRTLQLGKTDNKTPTNTSSTNKTSRTGLYTRKTTTTSNHPAYLKASDKRSKDSRLSAPSLNRVEPVETEPRRSSMGSNLNKSKSSSMHSLSLENEDTKKEPSKSRACWSTSKLASYGSVPNLFQPDDDKRLSPIVMKAEMNTAKGTKEYSKGSKTTASKNSVQVNKSVGRSVSSKQDNVSSSSSRSTTSGRLSGSTLSRSSSVEDRSRRSTSNLAAVGKKTNDKVSDRDLMPPPTLPVLAKQKPETRFMKRAHQQARRKTTSDLTLEQATDILKGNSGILKKNQKDRRSSSTSPDRHKSDGPEKENFKPINDTNFLNVASEIEQTAAEMRRQNSSGFKGEAVPNDLPERDIPPVRDIPKSKQEGPNNLTNNKTAVSKTDKNQNEVGKPSIVVNSVLKQENEIQTNTEEDGEPSPSVRERIARLNKHVTDVNRQSSPYRDRLRSESPGPVSPRVSSSVTLNLSDSNTSPAVNTSMSSSIDSAISSSHSEPITLTSQRAGRGPLQPIPFDPHGEVVHPAISSHGSHIPTSNSMTSAGPSLSPPTGLTSSLDSEGLSHHLSPSSYHSNTSPQSVADTGVGSDTDFDLSVSQSSSTFKGDQKTPEDPVTVLEETMDQMKMLYKKAMENYSLIQDCEDDRSKEARRQFRTMTKSMSDNLGVTSYHDDMSTIPVPIDKYNTLTDLLLKVNSVAADIRHCSSP